MNNDDTEQELMIRCSICDKQFREAKEKIWRFSNGRQMNIQQYHTAFANHVLKWLVIS